jgi:GNAT superfamily N-acetyltransferase
MEIKKVEKADLEEVIALAVAAFHDTPLYRYIAPDEGEREVFLRVFFGTRFQNGFGTNVMEAAYEEGRILGAASWTPPSQAPVQVPQAVDANTQIEMVKRMRARFEEPMKQAGASEQVLNRCAELLQTLAASSAKNTQEPHWQLAPVFIHPAFQGKGIGSALMRKQFAVIGEAPITLTTQEADNVELYAHYGFTVTSETPIGNSGVKSWGMCKPPGAA